ncbi:MAG: hypothetical protein II147_07190 [Lachnospiraceae bacterium]|nr:hypothetical protein [Lachnospiraceae bacterium]
MKERLLSGLLITALALNTCFISPVSAKTEKDTIITTEQSLPAKYDLREKGLVSSVKNQGNMATCTFFALCSALESSALMKGYGEYNLSERHLAYFTTHYGDADNDAINKECAIYCEDKKWYEDHTAEAPIATLMKGFGPGLESAYAYSSIKGTISAAKATDGAFKLKGCYFIPHDDKNAIKAAVQKYGAVVMNVYPYCWNLSRVCNQSSGAVYAANTSRGSGFHFLNIVGWDDNYSKRNFLTTPPGDGAWIVKNSWGQRTGDKGYYYISYYDAELQNPISPWFSFEVAAASMYDYQYQYDGGAGIDICDKVSSVAIAFKGKEDETLTGIQIKPEGSTTATVSLYRNVSSPSSIGSAKAIYTKTYTIDKSGYQTLEFDKTVNINKGESILAVVSFKDSVSYYVDKAYTSTREQGGRGIATANKGETFIKMSGSWRDLATCLNKPASACIKVLAKKGHGRKTISKLTSTNLGKTNLSINNNKEATASLSWDSIKNAKNYNIYRKGEKDTGYTLIKSVDGNKTKYDDTGLTLGTKYSYMVIAVSGSAESSSPIKTATATIATTWIKTLDNSERGKIKITIATTKSAESYSIYRLEGDKYKLIGSTKTGTFTDKNVEGGKTYSYKVRAVKGKLLSAYSGVKKVTAKN